MPFGLYVHYPFCRNHCAYCDFYKELYDPDLEKRFYQALTRETELAAEDHPDGDRTISTIFIGGGTPSLTATELLSRWLDRLKSLFEVPPGIEFSIECNPESVNLENLEIFRDLGINRPVFGIQSFNRDLLKVLDRRHQPHHSYRAVYYANALGYVNFGCDVIFGFPGQSSRMLAADLGQVIELSPPHISFYQLTVEPGTILHRQVTSGVLKMPSSDMMHTLYKLGCDQMAEADYERYEVSSFAREGRQCIHNLAYWEGADYLGLGPSAHSFMGSRRSANVTGIFDYISALETGRRPRTTDESGAKERAVEAIMLGLRTSRGISRERFAERFDSRLEEYL
ncbi:MAG: radical SAM family heme chaperone HemW, partial [candidate division Zixibacteria bacterium]|nr:radical SAM family heme chaperone HemW [candidate division Zixibacteria bacterium]